MAIPTIHNDITLAKEVKEGKHNYMNAAGITKYLTKLHKYETMLRLGIDEEYKDKDGVEVKLEEKIDKQNLIWSIIEFLQEIGKFNAETDYDIVRNTVRKYLKKNRPLVKEVNIKITKDELESVVALKNDHLETLAFGILVIQKINNLKFGKKSNYFNMKSRDYYFEITKDKRNKENQNKALASLVEANWITLPPIEKFGETDGFYLNCIDLDIKDKDVEIVTGDFREIDLIYKKWKNDGKGIGVCEECGRFIELTTSNNKYCPKCQKEVQLKIDAEYQRKKRKKRKIE